MLNGRAKRQPNVVAKSHSLEARRTVRVLVRVSDDRCSNHWWLDPDHRRYRLLSWYIRLTQIYDLQLRVYLLTSVETQRNVIKHVFIVFRFNT